MSVENQEERSVEVLALPGDVDEELLYLYFENRGRSGGGPLVSVKKTGNRALLVFEEAEAAARVLSKRHHVLHNAELNVRRPASIDQRSLLLRGVNPKTDDELVELYVENIIGLNMSEYTLYPSSGRDLVLIHLNQSFSKDLPDLKAKVSRRPLDGAMLTLEQIQQTDSILVENLHPGTSPDLLSLYFEGKQDQKVKEVTALSEGTAKVSFVSFESAQLVLDHPHEVSGSDLVVKPYFSFLQPTESVTAEHAETESNEMAERSRDNPSDFQMQASPPTVVSANSHAHSSQTSMEPPATPEVVAEAAEEVMEVQTPDPGALSSHIAMNDPGKRSLFQSSTVLQDIENTHPNFTIQIKQDGVHVSGPDIQTLEKIKQTILDFFLNVAQAHFTLEPEKAQFFSCSDVKQQLLQTMKQSGSPSWYTVSDCVVVVTSLSQSLADQAFTFMKSQISNFSIPVTTEYECMLYSREWLDFLQGLGFTCVKVSDQGGNIDVLTLKGMETEKQTAILTFLTTPIEREMVISMEPGVLKYIQTHHHLLLTEMVQVSILPLQAQGICGLKISGPAAACQTAGEVLQGVASSICTRTLTVNVPGVTRYLNHEECKNILKEMEKKFQVYIVMKHVPWEPLPNQDVSQVAWKMMSHKNFQSVSRDGSVQGLKSGSISMDHIVASGRGLLDKIEGNASASAVGLGQSVSISDPLGDFDDVDLYTAGTTTNLSNQGGDMAAGNATGGLHQLNDGGLGSPSSPEEDAQLSLAIQYSLESCNWSAKDEEQQLLKALELSKSIVQQEVSSSSTNTDVKVVQPEKGSDISLLDAIPAANTLQIVVYAGYSCDIIRVDIAFNKKVAQRQVEEKLEHRKLKDMTEFHKKCLEVIKRKHAVHILVQDTQITISGFKDYVDEAVSDVKLLLEKISHSVLDQDILRTIQWVQHEPVSSGTIPYSPDATVFIENAWRMKLKTVDILLDNQPHMINFEKMQLCSKTSGKSVKIYRKLIGLEPMEEAVPDEETSLLSNMPDATRISEASEEYRNVVKDFYETVTGCQSEVKVVQVEKLMNRLLYNQYNLKKTSVLQHSTYPVVERTLYHGTSEATVKEICVHGFNRSFCGKNATVHGRGVYFAVSSSLSLQSQYSPPNADGHKFIFVSKVLTGDFTKGCHTMKTAPLKEAADIPYRYDSVTDDINKPTMFVIFNDTQAYPEYLITCKKMHS